MRTIAFLVAFAILEGVLADVFLGSVNNGMGLLMFLALLGAIVRYIVLITPKGEDR